MRNFILFAMIALATAACSPKTTTGTNGEVVEIQGQIKESGMTTYQYGTHTITAENKLYALKSSTLNLNDYLEKKVRIKAIKVEGYPVENGPDFLDVTAISTP